MRFTYKIGHTYRRLACLKNKRNVDGSQRIDLQDEVLSQRLNSTTRMQLSSSAEHRSSKVHSFQSQEHIHGPLDRQGENS